MKTRILIQNNVSTGDLNRGRRTKSRLLFGSFCRSKKNVKPFPFGNFPLHGKQAHVGAARCACYKDSRFCKPRISAPLRGFSAACGGYPCCCRNNMFAASRHFPWRRPLPVHAKRVCRLLRKHSRRLGRRLEVPFRELSTVWKA